MIEHISHFKIEEVLCEINRVMKVGGILRVLTPDLKKLARAYVDQDKDLLKKYIEEDDSGIRSDLGAGQAFMSFLVSPGYDNFLCDSDLSRPLAGYGHVFCYDFEMLSGLLKRYGFGEIRNPSIDDSLIPEHKELRNGPYDKDRLHTLVVECKKERDAHYSVETCILHGGPYHIPSIGKNQQLITRPVMRVTSWLDGILYKTIKTLVGLIKPELINKKHGYQFEKSMG